MPQTERPCAAGALARRGTASAWRVCACQHGAAAYTARCDPAGGRSASCGSRPSTARPRAPYLSAWRVPYSRFDQQGGRACVAPLQSIHNQQPAAALVERREAGEDPANDAPGGSARCGPVVTSNTLQLRSVVHWIFGRGYRFVSCPSSSFVRPSKMSGHVAWLNKPSEAWKQRTVRLSARTLTTRLSLSLACTAASMPPDA